VVRARCSLLVAPGWSRGIRRSCVCIPLYSAAANQGQPTCGSRSWWNRCRIRSSDCAGKRETGAASMPRAAHVCRLRMDIHLRSVGLNASSRHRQRNTIKRFTHPRAPSVALQEPIDTTDLGPEAPSSPRRAILAPRRSDGTDAASAAAPTSPKRATIRATNRSFSHARRTTHAPRTASPLPRQPPIPASHPTPPPTFLPPSQHRTTPSRPAIPCQRRPIHRPDSGRPSLGPEAAVPLALAPDPRPSISATRAGRGVGRGGDGLVRGGCT
jgi:hypothetical protein